MRLFRWGLMIALVGILAVAVQQTLLFFGIWVSAGESQVKSLENDDQEIALIEPATNIDDWGRLVTAVQLLEADWPRINPKSPALQVSVQDAFPRLTADVSEISLSFADAPRQQLKLRWYKISGEHDEASWVKKLHARKRQPLAIIGGGTSNRAVRLARALQRTYDDSPKPGPTLLITTATAEKTGKGNMLIGIYAKRTFRFSFTNQRMVASLLQFVEQNPNLWPYKPADPQVVANAVVGVVGVHLQPYTMHTVKWMDERYSQDMADHFEREFKARFPVGRFYHQGDIDSAVGEFFQPAPQEQVMVDTFLSHESPIAPNSFLVLPTQSVRMRRFLINLRQRSPQDARNLVILNGDAIAFHAVYRDRDVLWNILDLPYSLLFFSHRDPINHAAGFDWTKDEHPKSAKLFPQRTTTGTHDVLLYRDLIEAIVYAAFDGGRLLGDPGHVRERLAATSWYLPSADKSAEDPARVCNSLVHHGQLRPFFDAAGNRQSHTGEHIIWVKPNFTDDRVDLTSTISVWTVRPDDGVGEWQLVEKREVRYNQAR